MNVYFNKEISKYVAKFTHQEKLHHCGNFLNELEAAQAVNAKCVELDLALKNPEVGLPENTQKLKQVRFIHVYSEK